MDTLRLQCGKCDHTFTVPANVPEGDQKAIHKCPACGKLVMVAGTGDDLAISGAYPVANLPHHDEDVPNPFDDDPTERTPLVQELRAASDAAGEPMEIAEPRRPTFTQSVLAVILFGVATFAVFWVLRGPAPGRSPVNPDDLASAVSTMKIEDRDGVRWALISTVPAGVQTNRGAVDLCRAAQAHAGVGDGKVIVARTDGTVVVRCEGKLVRLE